MPVLTGGCETQASTRYLCARIDAIDTRDLHKISRIPYSRHIKRGSQAMLECPPLSCNMAMESLLRFFCHTMCSAPNEDRHLALAAAIRKPPVDWKRRPYGDPITHGSVPLCLI